LAAAGLAPTGALFSGVTAVEGAFAGFAFALAALWSCFAFALAAPLACDEEVLLSLADF
jgi:hypothetical protein